MVDARHYVAEHTLRNGSRVTIRAVRPDDRERIARAFGQLDPDSVYTRFFTFKSELSDSDLARLDAIDFVHEVMLVATVGPEADEIVIGSARYVELDGTDDVRSAEVAFTVEEDYQGMGVAGRLLASLVAIAREAGFGRFEADVLPGNKSMLAVFTRSGLPVLQRREDGVVHVALALPA